MKHVSDLDLGLCQEICAIFRSYRCIEQDKHNHLSESQYDYLPGRCVRSVYVCQPKREHELRHVFMLAIEQMVLALVELAIMFA